MLMADFYDESMVLLRRVFNWTTKDILYRKINRLKAKRNTTWEPYPEVKKQFQRFQLFDYAVYNHFLSIFQQKVKDEGEDFQEELKHYVDVQIRVSQFCEGQWTSDELHVAGSRWSEGWCWHVRSVTLCRPLRLQ